MKKESFIKRLSWLKDRMMREARASNAITELDPDFNTGLFLFSEWHQELISLIEEAVGDSAQWTHYFIYETNWGVDSDIYRVFNPDGTAVKLKTIEDLYELVVNG